MIETAHIAPFTMIGFVLTQAGIPRGAKCRDCRRARCQESGAFGDLPTAGRRAPLKRESLESINVQLEKDNQAAAQQLIQADKLATLGTLVAGVAHDIANPATLIVGSTAVMGESRNALREGLDALLEDETDDEIVALREHFTATLMLLIKKQRISY